MPKLLIFALTLVALATLSGCGAPITYDLPQEQTNMNQQTYAFPGRLPDEQIANKIAVVKTSYGDIKIELNNEEAPLTVSNFVYLASQGFYNGLTFHRVEPGFVVQGGDPKGDGTGGPGYTVPAEISPDLKHLKGTVAMARLSDQVNPSRDSSGSQFYIALADLPFLDGAYTIFGQVVEGMAAVEKIQVGDKIESISITESE
jgi:peptidyl-prolyl cis-trans isomerase B (cyclophilin B)